MKKVKILTTGAGAPGARGIFKSYEIGAKSDGNGVEIVTCDMDKSAYGFHLASKSYVIPQAEAKDFIEKLLEICRKEKPDFLVSWVDPELLPISKSRKRFEELGTKVVISDPNTVEISQDKTKTYQMIKNTNLAPDFRIVKNSDEFIKAVKSLGYPGSPVCFKPAFSYGLRGFRILKTDVSKADILFKYKPSDVFINLEDAVSIFEECEKVKPLPKLLVMEYLEGKEYSVDMLVDRGKPIITVPRERVVTKHGISNIAYIENNKEVRDAAERIAGILKLSYNVNMQFRYDGNGPKLIEVHPRLSGTVIACMGAGVNFPYLGVKLARGDVIPKVDVKWGTAVKRFWEEVYIKNGKKWFLFP